MRTILLFAFLGIGLGLFGQTTAPKEKYWIFFTDKGDLSAIKATDILSEWTLQRRMLRGIPIDLKDYPVNPQYVSGVAGLGIEKMKSSKWLNSMTAKMDADDVAAVLALPYVKEVRKCRSYSLDYGWIDSDVSSKTTGHFPEETQGQNSILGLDVLHNADGGRLIGSGIRIAVMDNGFRGVDTVFAFQHLHEDGRILATHDFVEGDDDVFTHNYRGLSGLGGSEKHGTWVLSLIAGFEYTFYEGAAPGATFLLARTENDSIESHQEEDNWIAAAEWADSIGVDILSTSLGYSTDMADGTDYTYADLDGNTAIITLGADIAASRGLLVVNSAGNEGNHAWKYVTSPADGDSVVAVGAVDKDGIRTNFSSFGPTADGRIKPDLMAMGGGNKIVDPNGLVKTGSGTSFSCPMLSGFAACLWQSKPELTNMELLAFMKQSADRYLSPDTAYGWGIPNGPLALDLIHEGEKVGITAADELLNEHGVVLFPNPASEWFSLLIENYFEGGYTGEIQIHDVSGRKVFQEEFAVMNLINEVRVDRNAHPTRFATGLFYVSLFNKDSGECYFRGKVILD